MNLDDYSYEFEDRRYLNPQVSLDEQNAFIDNLRNLQEQNNAQITQQTYNLGSQLPSNKGGLVGGGSYFRSRYQTPQTNQSIADLRTAAQAQALNTLLFNEVSKAQKRYKDAYRKVQSSGGGSGNGNNELLIDSLKSKLNVETETDIPDTITPSEDTKAGEPNRAWYDKSLGAQIWTDENGLDWEMMDIPGGNVPIQIGGDLAVRPKSGEVVTVGGKKYIYIDNGQYNGSWFLLGDRIYR